MVIFYCKCARKSYNGKDSKHLIAQSVPLAQKKKRVPFPQCPVTHSTLPSSFLENKVFKTLNSKIANRIFTHRKTIPLVLHQRPSDRSYSCSSTCSVSHVDRPTATGRGKRLHFYILPLFSKGLRTEGQTSREQLWPDLMKALCGFPSPLLLFQTHFQSALGSGFWEEITRKSSPLCVNTTVAEAPRYFSEVI